MISAPMKNFQYKIIVLLIGVSSFSNALVAPCLTRKYGTGLKVNGKNNIPTLIPSIYQEDVSITSSDLPPALQYMVDERREYELNLGKAMDTLRKDYPELLRRQPDYSIYHEDIKVSDPSGLQTIKLTNYRSSIRILQSLVGLIYNTDRSTIQNRMVYDFTRDSIRVSWNIALVPKVVGNDRNSLYIDGVSVYKLNAKGVIVEHRFEKLLINNNPVVPPYNIFLSLVQGLSNPNEGLVPVGLGA